MTQEERNKNVQRKDEWTKEHASRSVWQSLFWRF